MNKSALKTFATSARKELLKKIEAKALKIGITEANIKKVDIESSDAIFIDGKQLSKEEKNQRDKLITRINQIGFKQVMEEVAYTWFNRFTAIRYMEVNEYLPTDVRVLSSTNADSAEPDMINEALSLELDIDKEYVYDLKLNNKTEELFKYLIIKHCNDLNRFLPFMFETIDHYTEILFPEGLLTKDSFIRQMTDTDVIPESNWKKIEVIGWLYQYYIAEEKDRVFKAKKKYKTEEIPFATQLFTPDWIVRYMVQNSLGRYWVESHPEQRNLVDNWDLYIENPNSEQNFDEEISPYISKELKVEDIKCFDPAMGSGHILVYMFDVMFEIYSKCGYMEREIPRLILENNLYGLDIDDRAYQLACFSVVMKAVEYNSRFFRSIEREGLTLNMASIQETNILNEEELAYLAGENSGVKLELVKDFIALFRDAKSIGSLIKVTKYDKCFLKQRLDYIQEHPPEDLFKEELRVKILNLMPDLLKQAEIMSMQFDILVTNPPYMGSASMNTVLSEFLKKHYTDSKADLFASFMEVDHYLKPNGFYSMINQHSWMFLSSFNKLRGKIINNKSMYSMLHLGSRAFEDIGGEVVQTTAFTLRNCKKQKNSCIFIKLTDFKESKLKELKSIEAIKSPDVSYRYVSNLKNFLNIPGNPIAFWATDEIISIFKSKNSIGKIGETRIGMATANNERFLRYWHEMDLNKIGFNCMDSDEAFKSKLKWFPYTKGGEFRKWFGNVDYVVNWENDGFEIRNFKDEVTGKVRSHNYNLDFIFKPGLTWSSVSGYKFSIRMMNSSIIGSGGSAIVNLNKKEQINLIGFLNSNITNYLLDILSSTLNYEVNTVASLPVKIDQKYSEVIEEIVEDCISISKDDWNSYENSWEFRKNPLLTHQYGSTLIQEAFDKWGNYTDIQFEKLRTNEERLNDIYLEIYNLKNELSPNVDEKDVTIRKADQLRDIKFFISYAVGCIFGRYSLDEEGLIFAGGEFNSERYLTINADKDNILPILPGVYFEDDIVSRFIKFVQVTFGTETLTENLDFIANTLGKKKGETAKETIRRYLLNDFFKDHVQTYKKRPIYWLFTSGKQKAFNCLIYMQRYDKTTLSRIRIDYLHEYQNRLDAEKKDLLSIIEGDYTAKEISNAKKELKTLDKKIEELKEYDELLHHMADMQIEIDLDDGVTVNYEKFKGLVAKI